MSKSIYEVAREEPSAELAGWIRVVIARIAVDNAAWREAYDQMLQSTDAPRHPESVTLRGDAREVYEPVLLADLASTPAAAGSVLREQAEILAGRPLAEPSDVDLAAAVVAAEIWMTVLRADDLSYAAGKGPDAISAAAAILARAGGEGTTVMPFDPDWPKLRYPLQRVLEAAATGRAWTERHLGPDVWTGISSRVVTDLSYNSHGGSKTHEAALLLGVRMLDIPPAH